MFFIISNLLYCQISLIIGNIKHTRANLYRGVGRVKQREVVGIHYLRQFSLGLSQNCTLHVIFSI